MLSFRNTVILFEIVKQVNHVAKRPPAASRALAKGLELLEALGASGEPTPLRDLADAVGLGKASVFRLVQTLVSTGFASQEDDGRYSLNCRWLPGAIHNWLARARSAALPEMQRLNAELAETVTLAALIEDHIRVLETVESPQHIRMSNYRDRILPPNASSLGKAIASFQSADVQQRLLHVYGIYQQTPKTITEPAAIRAEFSRVREQGWAEEIEETVTGGCCFAAPIVVPREPVRAAISTSLPVTRLTSDLRLRLPGLLTDAAARISKKLR